MEPKRYDTQSTNEDEKRDLRAFQERVRQAIAAFMEAQRKRGKRR